MNNYTNTEVLKPKFFDLSLVEKICYGNDETRNKMLQTFINTIPIAVNELKSAYRQLDFTTIKEKAHHIKPTLAFYAIVTIERDIEDIVNLEKNELSFYNLGLKIEKLEFVIKNVIAEMKNKLPIN